MMLFSNRYLPIQPLTIHLHKSATLLVIPPAEDCDPILAALGDAYFVEVIVDETAVHFEEAAHLLGVADWGVGPAVDCFFGSFVALGQVVGGESVEAVALGFVPNPTALVVMGE